VITPAKAQAPIVLKLLSVFVGIVGIYIISCAVECAYELHRLYLQPDAHGVVGPFHILGFSLVGGWMIQMPYRVFFRYSGKWPSWFLVTLVIASVVAALVVFSVVTVVFNL
jgi:hypothetical protein